MAKWGLCLGGGGVLGFAHLGVLEVMEEHGLRPSCIAGTSAGAIVAALYALGIPLPNIASAMEAFALEQRKALSLCVPRPRLHPLSLHGPAGLIGGEAIEAILHKVTGGRKLSETNLPVSIVSVDLVTGETVVFTSEAPPVTHRCGSGRSYIVDAAVSEAVRASISIPVVFAPKILGQRVLVDGGVKELIPAYETRRMGADEVVAVDVSSEADKPQKVSGMLGVLLRTFTVMEREATSRHLAEYASLVIQPETGHASFPTPAEARRLVEAGRAAARASIDRWVAIACS